MSVLLSTSTGNSFGRQVSPSKDVKVVVGTPL